MTGNGTFERSERALVKSLLEETHVSVTGREGELQDRIQNVFFTFISCKSQIDVCKDQKETNKRQGWPIQ